MTLQAVPCVHTQKVSRMIWPYLHSHLGGFPDGLAVKTPPAIQEPQETRVPFLGWADPLGEGMATHSSILVWSIPIDRGAWPAEVHGAAELDATEVTLHACILTPTPHSHIFSKTRNWFILHMLFYNLLVVST